MRRGHSRVLPCAPEAGTPEEKLVAFVAQGRLSRLHGRTCPFEAARWDVGPEVTKRPGVPARPGPLRVSFAAVDTGPPALGALVRAYLGTLPRSGHGRLQALAQAAGLVGEAMRALGVVSVAELNVATLNAAAVLARQRTSPGRAARLGYAILEMGAFLHGTGMTRLPLVGAQRPTGSSPDLDRVGQAAVERRRRLLPSGQFLDALADAHRLATEPADIIVTRLAAILLSVAARINEALALGERPEVERELAGSVLLGLRWTGSKGASDGVKWVVPAMAPVVRGACADLRLVTEEGRRIKRWYDTHPRELYLPAAMEHLRGRASLAPADARTLLGPYRSSMPPGPGAAAGGPAASSGAAAAPVSFAEVEAHLLAFLPARMRDAGGPRSHPLLVVPAGTFGARGRLRCPCMFEMVARRHVVHALAGPLFRRLGLDAGGWHGGRTHPFRHLLVTEALRGGLSEAEAAEWCGHSSPREVRAYDHRTAAEMRAIIGRASKVSHRFGSLLAREDWSGGPADAADSPT